MKKLPVSMTPTERSIGWIYWGLQLLVLPIVMSMLLEHFGIELSETRFNFLFFAINFVCLTVILRRFLGKNAIVALHQPFRTLRYAFGAFALFWLSTVIIGSVTKYYVPGFSNVNDATILDMANQEYTLTAIGTVLLAPVAEELMYRGLIFDALHHRSPAGAFFVTTVVFAAIHVVGYIGHYRPFILLLCFLQYIPAGLCLGWAYTKSGTIWAPILAHIAINQTTILTMR